VFAPLLVLTRYVAARKPRRGRSPRPSHPGPSG
jgi:hypothetical protein